MKHTGSYCKTATLIGPNLIQPKLIFGLSSLGFWVALNLETYIARIWVGFWFGLRVPNCYWVLSNLSINMCINVIQYIALRYFYVCCKGFLDFIPFESKLDPRIFCTDSSRLQPFAIQSQVCVVPIRQYRKSHHLIRSLNAACHLSYFSLPIKKNTPI